MESCGVDLLMAKIIEVRFGWKRKIAFLIGKPLLLKFSYEVRAEVRDEELYINKVDQKKEDGLCCLFG